MQVTLDKSISQMHKYNYNINLVISYLLLLGRYALLVNYRYSLL